MAASEVITDNQAAALPLVTIGMPIRNGDPYFERALASVLAQDYPNLEIVVSDNGSTDGTAEILARAAATDPRIRVFRQSEMLTAFDNFAWVLRQARGLYFMWAAHDDLRPANYVSSLVASLQAYPEAVLAFGDLRVSPVLAKPMSTSRLTTKRRGWDVCQGCVALRSCSAITSTDCGGPTRSGESRSSSMPGGRTCR
ncbi:MAG: glycosyltransferase family 2 protein [Betaproteobacteria bacterium]|uniref:Glycosyltransferase family 2 protein n=1 Tax=Candidatus Proximibacter danicus TaxID=2954365 RepID=A0A9D7PPQ4_9PROT|nr:glycosyltransferase family 2 protein [Candidatus Proximibacter danicus]